MRVRLLGPIELWHGGDLLAAGAPKQKTVLALLLARANTIVPVDDLIDELWPDQPPPSALANARMYAANLRRLLAAAPQTAQLTKSGPGYLVRVEPAEFDVARFRELARQGRALHRRGEPVSAVSRFDEAVGLWRGRAVADAVPGRWLTGWRVAIEDERLSVLDDRVEAMLAAGAHAQAATRARELLLQEPLRERTHALLMRACYQAGDVSAALAAYDAARRDLVQQLGIEPGDELRRLQRAVLNREPLPPLAPDAVAVAPAASVTRPRQLPVDAWTFTGRAAQLRQLDTLLRRDDHAPTGADHALTGGDHAPTGDGDRAPTAVVISAIAGTAGIGKTALAVHWAHRVRDRFPDGQLYVNLRGFGPTGSVMRPTEALRAFLTALDVPAQRIPTTLTAQAALYRTLLADRRMLILLDNARDAEQARPLIPGSPGCLTLVTSRDRLSGLVAAEGAHPLELDVLSPPEARELLARRLGADRVAAEPDAADEIIARCAGLPLALTLVAARAAYHPGLALRDLAAAVREARDALDVFDSADPVTDMRVVFSWSYQALSEAAARLFRLVGLHPGPDFTVPAAASLAGVPAARIRPLLSELAGAHLIVEQAPGRYGCHDLLRAYAAELADAVDSGADRRAAVHRVLDHYLHTAHAAAQLLRPQRDPITPAPPRPGVAAERLADHGQALAWLTAEHPVLVAAVGQAAGAGFHDHTWQLAWTLADYFQRRGHWQDWATTQHAALSAARRTGDRARQAQAHRGLGRAYARLGHADDAHTHYRHALRIFRELDDDAGQGHTRRGLAWLLEMRGRLHESLEQNRAALTLFRAAGHRVGEADAANAVGWGYAQVGDHRRALAHCERALELFRELGDRHGEAFTLDSLGFVHSALGAHAEASTCFRAALVRARELGDDYLEAVVLGHLADTLHATGDTAAARENCQRAVAILDELGHPEADRVRRQLDDLSTAYRG